MSLKMEYNLQKWLEPTFYSPANNLISPFPSTDFVNPGIGNVVNLFSTYVPIHSNTMLHPIEKKLDTALMQEGSGMNESQPNEV